MKVCSKCKARKNLFEFHFCKAMKDGHQARCKECAKKNSIEHRAENITHARAYDKERDKSKSRTDALRTRKYLNLSKYPERNKARLHAFSAIKSGKLTPLPCFMCGEIKVDAHHPDYSAPLDVVWLCRSHHMQAHAISK